MKETMDPKTGAIIFKKEDNEILREIKSLKKEVNHLVKLVETLIESNKSN